MEETCGRGCCHHGEPASRKHARSQEQVSPPRASLSLPGLASSDPLYQLSFPPKILPPAGEQALKYEPKRDVWIQAKRPLSFNCI